MCQTVKNNNARQNRKDENYLLIIITAFENEPRVL